MKLFFMIGGEVTYRARILPPRMANNSRFRYVGSIERWLVIATVVATAFFVSSQSKESFRTPKELLFHILVLLAIAISAMRWAAGDLPTAKPSRRIVFWIVAAILGWTVLTSLTSTNTVLSRFALVHATLAAAFFWIALGTASENPGYRPTQLALALSVPNAAVALLQGHDIWSPFPLEDLGSHRLKIIGFLGNPNDLGGFLVPCAVVHLAMVLGGPKNSRWMHGTAFAFVSYAITATESATAIASLLISAALMVLFSFRSLPKRLFAFGVLFSLILLIAIPLAISEQQHLAEKWRAARQGSIKDLFGDRLLAYSAAWVMTREHPVLGVGPGTFSWNYMRSVGQARRRYPNLPRARRSFGEAHSDYLEILAETGFPGLALAIGAITIFTIARGIRQPGERSELSKIGSRLRIPLSASLMIQMTVNFPLQITAILVLYLYLGANVIAWQESSDLE